MSELLTCPRCGPGHGLVVSVDRIEARRVLEGRLACPGCDARYPVSRGLIDFGAAAAGGRARTDAAASRPRPAGRDASAPSPGAEDAVRVAALLGLGEGGGAVLLGRGLEAAAARVAELGEGVEVLCLASDRGEGRAQGEEGGAPRVTRLAGVAEEALPLHGRRLRGAALLGGSPEALREAARVVRPGGRVTVLRPTFDLESSEDVPLRTLAEGASAAVAERTGP